MNHLVPSTERERKKTLITLKDSKDPFELIFVDMAPNNLTSYTFLAYWLTE